MIDEFGADFDFMDVDPDRLEHLEMASDLVWAYKELLSDFARMDVTKLQERLTGLPNERSYAVENAGGVGPSELAGAATALIDAIPIQQVVAAQNSGFRSCRRSLGQAVDSQNENEARLAKPDRVACSQDGPFVAC